MMAVELVGPPEDRRFARMLGRALAGQPALWLEGGGLTAPEAPPALAVLDLPAPCPVRGAPVFLVIKDSLRRFEGLELPPCGGAAVASDHAAALELLARSGSPAVTCGLSARDTLTLTSIAEGGAVIALQRSLPTWDGGRAEPMELPVCGPCGPAERYPLLCCAAVLAFCGLLPGPGRLDL